MIHLYWLAKTAAGQHLTIKTLCLRFLLTTNFQPVGVGDKRSPISRLLTAGSDATLNDQEENLSAYFEPFGSALIPCAPGNRDSIASNESDTLLPDRKENMDTEVFGLV